MNWEMLIIMLGVSIPLAAMAFYAMYRENKEKREERKAQMQANDAQLSNAEST